MSPDGDIRIKLLSARGESLLVTAERSSVTDEQRTGLQQIARWPGGEIVAARDPNLAAHHADAGAEISPRVRERDERLLGAVDPKLAKRKASQRRLRRRTGTTKIKPADERLGDTALRAPRRQRSEGGKPTHLQRGRGERIARDVRSRVSAIVKRETQALKRRRCRLLDDGRPNGHRAHPC
jgi:hypothetical protein